MEKSKVLDIIGKYLEFKCQDENGNEEQPFVITAPARGKDFLRVYAYGGSAGEIGCIGQTGCRRASKEYGKYLEAEYTDEQKHRYAVPEWLSEEAPAELWADRSKLPFDGEQYMSLTAAALQNRSRYHAERREQSRIARKFMSVRPGEGMLVTDIEYVAPKLFTGKVKLQVFEKHKQWKKDSSKGRKSLLKIAKPDFVMFDGKSFGFVEFKYDGKSMEAGGENGLREHLLDCADILASKDDYSRKLYDWKSVTDADDLKRVLAEEGRGRKDTEEKVRQAQWEMFGDCCKNMRTLLTYGLISPEWEAALEEMEDKYAQEHENGAFDRNLLWCGFLFVGGGKDAIELEIKKQLSDFIKSKLDIRYQYSDTIPDKLTMDESVREYFLSIEEW